MDASVIVTTYNLRDTLGRCLAGLNFQDYPKNNFEVIICDDGSRNDWRDALFFLEGVRIDAFTRQHEGFRLASLKNNGLERATGKVVALLDGDMIPPRRWLRAHVEAIAQDSSFAISIGERRFVNADALRPGSIGYDPKCLEMLPRVRSASNWFNELDRRLPELRALDGHPAPYHLFHGCNVAFPRDLASEVGRFDSSFDGEWGYEDTEFAYRMFCHGGRFVWSREAVAYHQENSVLDFTERERGDRVNYEIACSKIPGFREFKEKLRYQHRRPWW